MKLHLLIILTMVFGFNAFGQIIMPEIEVLTLGNPSKARTDQNQPDNYLVVHYGYSLSYNRSRGAANWVSWHLEKSDIGEVERTNEFAPDLDLPRDWWI